MKRLLRSASKAPIFIPLVDCLIFGLALKVSLVLLRRYTVVYWLHFVDFIPVFISWLTVFYALGLYEKRLINNTVSLVRELLISLPVCLGLGAVYFYLAAPYLNQTPKTILFVAALLSHLGVLAWRRALLILGEIEPFERSFFFLGSEEKGSAMRRHFNGSCRRADLNAAPELWNWSDVDLVVADKAWAMEHWPLAKAAFLSATERGVPIVSFESFYEARFGKISPYEAGHPSWALEFVLPKSGSLYVGFKRAVDVAASAVLLLALSPVMAAAWLAIVWEDGRPGFYGQTRIGHLGRPFTVWKFRTMKLTPESDKPFGSAREDKDERITAGGRMLRRFRLDELPQLWNVLKGEMSLVGPRPEWVKETAVLEKLVHNYHLRHLVKPGITGWAQVYFRATNNPDDSFEKLCYDLYYVKHFSPALDVSILLKTLKRVFIKDMLMIDSAPRIAARPEPAAYDWALETRAGQS